MLPRFKFANVVDYTDVFDRPMGDDGFDRPPRASTTVRRP